jgi:hypothetical protein
LQQDIDSVSSTTKAERALSKCSGASCLTLPKNCNKVEQFKPTGFDATNCIQPKNKLHANRIKFVPPVVGSEKDGKRQFLTMLKQHSHLMLHIFM